MKNAKATFTVRFLRASEKLRRLHQRELPMDMNGYYSLDHFILQHGKPWHPKEKPSWVHWGTIKECYCNAARLVMKHPRALIYCEGVALGVIPVMHAWAITNDGTVIDPTWRRLGREYFGIAFNFRFVCRTLLRQKYYGIIDRWEDRWPLLRANPHEYKHRIMHR